MVANLGDDTLFLVVNAACKEQDLAHLREHLGARCEVQPLFETRALLALQGPAAASVLQRLAPEVAQMTFMQVRRVTLLEALWWAVSKARRADGARAGGFPGAERVFEQQREGVARKRVGLLPQERTPVREGADIVDGTGKTVGRVSSGGFGPTLNAPVAMGYVDSEHSALETPLFAVVRGKQVALRVSKMPFVVPRYYRG